MIWHDVEQGTEEWFQLRCGKLGGSSIGKVMANIGKSFGQPAHDLAVKIAIEQITGRPIEQNYTNSHMERGHEQEPIARALYEQDQFVSVTNGGFFEDGDLYGVSPDGLVDDDGGIEIKSVIQNVQFQTVKRGAMDPSYKWQVYLELLVSGREWWDYVSFCSAFPEGKRLFIDRVWRKDSAEMFDSINSRVDEFRFLVDEKKKVIEDIR